MKRLVFSAIISMLITRTGFSQSKPGEVVCVYITTTDLDSSVSLYEKLGFPKIASNVFPVPWAQVSDGSLLIMLRKDALPYIGLTYYVTDIEKKAEQLEKDSIVFTQKPKEGDPVKRYYFKSPDGFNIMLASDIGAFRQPDGITLLSMKPEDFMNADKYPNRQCGAFGEFAHPVKDINISIAFWKKLGFKSSSEMKEPYPHAILSDGKMIIGLHQTNQFTFAAITYFGINTEQRIEKLKTQGINTLKEVMGKKNVSLSTWEGQHFFLFSLGM